MREATLMVTSAFDGCAVCRGWTATEGDRTAGTACHVRETQTMWVSTCNTCGRETGRGRIKKKTVGFPKPAKTRRQLKARQDRQAAQITKRVRADCVLRDGHCRMTAGHDDVFVGVTTLMSMPCEGPSEWAHFGDKRRSRTRGQAPQIRHTTEGSLMLCQVMHLAYDSGHLRITALTRKGCDGRLKFAWRTSR